MKSKKESTLAKFNYRFHLLVLFLGALSILCLSFPSQAGESLSNSPGQGRKKSLSFEDELIEGINKRPLDSLSYVADGNKKKRKRHLYWKRLEFSAATHEKLNELRLVQ